jgi:hypothetical protein
MLIQTALPGDISEACAVLTNPHVSKSYESENNGIYTKIITKKLNEVMAIMSNVMPKDDGDGLTTCHVCSIPHSSVIMVKRGRLGRISEMPLLPFQG